MTKDPLLIPILALGLIAPEFGYGQPPDEEGWISLFDGKTLDG